MTRIVHLPGLVDSLHQLVSDERYSLTDVGLMFGVSRERIRQLCDKYEIAQPMRYKSGLNAVRLWNDSLNRFEPVSRGVISEERKRQHSLNLRNARVRKYAARREHVIQTIKRLASELGRPPIAREVISAVVGKKIKQTSAGAFLQAYVGSQRRDDFRQVTLNLYRAAGVRKPRVGTPGHLSRKSGVA